MARFFSLCCMLTATVCVYKIGRYLFNENVGLLASLVFALTGSVQFVGKLATYDAPCLVLVALATTLAITKRSIAVAPIIGALLAMAAVTQCPGLGPGSLRTAHDVPRDPYDGGSAHWGQNFPRAFLRGSVATLGIRRTLIARRLPSLGIGDCGSG